MSARSASPPPHHSIQALTSGLVGTPFVVGVREPGVALDCLGAALSVLERLGLRRPGPPDGPGAFHAPLGPGLSCGLPGGLARVATGGLPPEPRLGDLLLLHDPTTPGAVGVAVVVSAEGRSPLLLTANSERGCFTVPSRAVRGIEACYRVEATP